MSRNVVRSLARPCAITQWHSKHSPPITRRWYAEQPSPQPEEAFTETKADDRARALYLLQVADQKYLHEVRKDLETYVSDVEALNQDLSSLPTTIRPHPKIPAYTLGPGRHHQKQYTSLVEPAIHAAQVLREHIIDLQAQPYGEVRNAKLKAFEREIAGWSEERKREKLEDMELHMEAKAARLMQKSEAIYQQVNETIARHSKLKGQPKEPMPEFGDAGARVEIRTEGKIERSWGRSPHSLDAEAGGTGWKDVEKQGEGETDGKTVWKPIWSQDEEAQEAQTKNGGSGKKIETKTGISSSKKDLLGTFDALKKRLSSGIDKK